MRPVIWHDVSRHLADSDLGGGANRAEFALWLGERDKRGRPMGWGYFVIRSRVLTNAPDDDELSADDGFMVRSACGMAFSPHDEENGEDIRLFDSQAAAKAFAEGHSAVAVVLADTSVSVGLVNGGMRAAKNEAVQGLEECLRYLQAAAAADTTTGIYKNVKEAAADAKVAELQLARLQGGIHALQFAPLARAESSDDKGGKQ